MAKAMGSVELLHRRQIVIAMRLQNKTFKEIGAQVGVTSARVRQIWLRAYKKSNGKIATEATREELKLLLKLKPFLEGIANGS